MQNKELTIHFIMTWWTIDSYYESTKDTAIPNEHSIIPRFINSLHLENSVEFTEICMKDSRQMTKDDLKNVLHCIEESKNKYFIVTHGTYTMPDSARYLEANLRNKGKVIILTGSMLPMAEFTMSDGWFNLGYAIWQIKAGLPNGIYVCMNWSTFSSIEVIKVVSEWRFSSILWE